MKERRINYGALPWILGVGVLALLAYMVAKVFMSMGP